MPSPLGHALAGFAVGWLIAPDDCRTVGTTQPHSASTGAGRLPGVLARAAASARRWRWPLAFAAAGMAADLDLLAGQHSRYTHSVGAALIVFVGAWLVLRQARGLSARPARAAVGLALGYASHVLLDWLGSDTTPPYGIMALWPLSDGFYLSPVTIFLGVSRRYWLATAWAQNAVSVLREVLVLMPAAAAALWLRPPRRLPFE